MEKLRFFNCCSLLLCLLSIQVQSQINPSPKRFIVNTDYSRFWQNDSTSYLEISTAVYSGYHGKIELIILIQNKLSGVFVHTNRFNIPVNLTDSVSLSMKKSIINKMTYTLACGSYNVTVLGYDITDRIRRDSTSFTVDINKRTDAVALSDVELCSSISESSDHNDNFYKNTYRVIPNPSCVFGSTTYPVVFSYTEFYNLNIEMTYAIKARVIDSKGEVKKHRTHIRRFSMPNVVDVTTLNVASISSGKYYYEIILSDTLGNEIAISQRPIFLYNPQIESVHTTTISARSAEFAGLSSEELAEEFKTAEYVARSEDKKIFDKLKMADERRGFLEKFWTRIEEEELGRSDITRAVYLQRVQTSNQRYRTLGKDGWRTDRGRVYIINGEPDEIQRFPSSQDSKPYEIWSYHQIEGGVEFVFIDLAGFNEYTLVHSTKRGEIQDVSWEQFLH
jgi:GWxTD domain-containing protein